jgi:para-nitrobenzyl esterase
MGPAGEPDWPPYQVDDPACMLIDKRDGVVHDIDARIRSAWGREVVSFR